MNAYGYVKENMGNNLKLLIIDLDGTLVDSKDDITESLNLTLASFGYDLIDIALVAQHVGTGIRPIIDSIVPKDQITKFLEDFEQIYIQNIAKHTLLFPGWVEVLSQTPDVCKIILSNKMQKFCDPLINQLNLQSYFSGIYGREAFNNIKPSPVPFREILKIHSFKPENTLAIGDMPSDIEGAKSAKINTCAALFGYGHEKDLLNLDPDYVINSPLELLNIVT